MNSDLRPSSFVLRPSIVWITPQVLDELRREAGRAPVQVREIPPLKRPNQSSDDNADTTNILLNAPRIVMAGLKHGWCKIVPHPPLGSTIANKGIHSQATRARMSRTRRRLARARANSINL